MIIERCMLQEYTQVYNPIALFIGVQINKHYRIGNVLEMAKTDIAE